MKIFKFLIIAAAMVPCVANADQILKCYENGNNSIPVSYFRIHNKFMDGEVDQTFDVKQSFSSGIKYSYLFNNPALGDIAPFAGVEFDNDRIILHMPGRTAQQLSEQERKFIENGEDDVIIVIKKNGDFMWETVVGKASASAESSEGKIEWEMTGHCIQIN